MNMLTEFKGLTRNQLKYIAIIAMTIDHIAWYFNIDPISPSGMIMHIIGRFTAPIMCFFIAEGYYYTKNIKKYLLRLGIFAAICHLIYIAENLISIIKLYGAAPIVHDFNYFIYIIFCKTSVMFTLFLGLLALVIIKSDLHNALKAILVLIIFVLSTRGDWDIIGVSWVLCFGLFRNNKLKKYISYYIVAFLYVVSCAFNCIKYEYSILNTVYQATVLLAPLILLLYNGKSGSHSSFHKWFFYIYYPVHIIPIFIISHFYITNN